VIIKGIDVEEVGGAFGSNVREEHFMLDCGGKTYRMT
jgi:hypothetical protein